MAAGTYRSKTGELINVAITASGGYKLTNLKTGVITFL